MTIVPDILHHVELKCSKLAYRVCLPCSGKRQKAKVTYNSNRDLNYVYSIAYCESFLFVFFFLLKTDYTFFRKSRKTIFPNSVYFPELHVPFRVFAGLLYIAYITPRLAASSRFILLLFILLLVFNLIYTVYCLRGRIS